MLTPSRRRRPRSRSASRRFRTAASRRSGSARRRRARREAPRAWNSANVRGAAPARGPDLARAKHAEAATYPPPVRSGSLRTTAATASPARTRNQSVGSKSWRPASPPTSARSRRCGAPMVLEGGVERLVERARIVDPKLERELFGKRGTTGGESSRSPSRRSDDLPIAVAHEEVRRRSVLLEPNVWTRSAPAPGRVPLRPRPCACQARASSHPARRSRRRTQVTVRSNHDTATSRPSSS